MVEEGDGDVFVVKIETSAVYVRPDPRGSNDHVAAARGGGAAGGGRGHRRRNRQR